MKEGGADGVLTTTTKSSKCGLKQRGERIRFASTERGAWPATMKKEKKILHVMTTMNHTPSC